MLSRSTTAITSRLADVWRLQCSLLALSKILGHAKVSIQKD